MQWSSVVSLPRSDLEAVECVNVAKVESMVVEVLRLCYGVNDTELDL